MFFGVLSFAIGMGSIFISGDITSKFFGFLLIVLAILLFVIGEIIGVAFAVEDNTKKIADCMSELKTLVEQSNSLLKQSNTILMQSKSSQKHSFNELA
jgi:uncharacterized membrane protein YqgA involved in biofilm formation